MSLLALREVTRTVIPQDQPALTILNGVDLVIEPGDHVSIVGRSGSGKSTLLNMLGLLDLPTSGEITFDDRPVRSYSSARRDRLRGAAIGFVFQQFNLLPGRTALENVTMPLLYASGRTFWRRTRIATEMLALVGLEHRLHSLPDRLSGGEQQRVAIARSLVRGPRLILADEPTGALDLDTGQSVMELIDEVAERTGAAQVVITHDPTIARRARRHFRLDRGVLTPVDDPTLEPLTRRDRREMAPASERAIVVAGAAPADDALARLGLTGTATLTEADEDAPGYAAPDNAADAGRDAADAGRDASGDTAETWSRTADVGAEDTADAPSDDTETGDRAAADTRGDA